MKKILLALLIGCFTSPIIAGEGMWLPILLKSLNEGEMQRMGMKLTAEDIYSVNQGSLKDAIVHFGGFCTSEIISDSGLLLTNHHCGYSNIQAHSSIENNYLKDGFWAGSNEEEIPNPGLFATFIDQIIDVSDKVLSGVEENMTVADRQSVIDQNIDDIISGYRLSAFQKVMVRPFFNGNQYFAFITTTFNDVRLVGTPPESIGKFGADTDNWVWPRHTGDFSLFRIYASPDNGPADYAEENVPYRPKHFLPISLDGVEEDDFTLVFGFPGRTNQYLPSYAVSQIKDVLNPAKIEIRDAALTIMDKYMRADESTRIQYASKFARIANYWKKWIGESQGLEKSGAIQRKKKYERKFVANGDKTNAKILSQFEELYLDIEPYALTRDVYSEVAVRNVELLRLMGRAHRVVNAYNNSGEKGFFNALSRFLPYAKNFYKNYNADIDREVFAALAKLYEANIGPKFIPEFLKKENMMQKGLDDFDAMAGMLYANSLFVNKDKAMSAMEQTPEVVVKTIKNDPAYQMSREWAQLYNERVAAPYNTYKAQIDSLQRIYMKAQMEVFRDKRFYPDANSTMRVTYGKVNGYYPRDAVYYTPVTYLDGVMEKYVPGDYEFDVPAKLIDLYNKKDYGQYADRNGKLPICFIGSNHTTGGNSGSPVIDAYGNLIGLNFDRVWEGTMSDINYDASICRNIMVDVRYVLFTVDKFAGARWLIDEMKLVHPKRRK